MGWFQNQFWANIVLSDMKKLNLDGPDGSASYWHDLAKASICHTGGGLLMIWAGTLDKGRMYLVFLSGNKNAEMYCITLKSSLLLFA